MLKLTVQKQDISKPLSQVQTIVDKKTIMAIINNVFLYTDENNLFLEATDLEVSFRTRIPCEIAEQGAMTLNARKFFEIVKEFPSELITLEETENFWITISGGEKAEYKIGGLPPDDFPRFRQLDNKNFMHLQSSIFADMIEKTIFSVSYDDTKYSLAGVFFEQQVEDDGTSLIRMVSSDGHRLSLVEKRVPNQALELEKGVIIPRKGAQEIRKMIDDSEELTFGIDEKFCCVDCKDGHLVIRLIDANFPNYQAIIPKTKERSLLFDRIQMYNALKRISILSNEPIIKGVKAIVSPGVMELESLQKEIGEAREVLDIDYQAEPFEIALNAKYIMNALAVMRSARVEMTSNSPDAPCLLRGDEDEGFLGLIMPMSIVREDENPEAE
jgi:DNA polymerase-3 subunit beta